eukprot:7532550-Lingulodinium_polyedra.AAC.1
MRGPFGGLEGRPCGGRPASNLSAGFGRRDLQPLGAPAARACSWWGRAAAATTRRTSALWAAQ